MINFSSIFDSEFSDYSLKASGMALNTITSSVKENAEFFNKFPRIFLCFSLLEGGREYSDAVRWGQKKNNKKLVWNRKYSSQHYLYLVVMPLSISNLI